MYTPKSLLEIEILKNSEITDSERKEKKRKKGHCQNDEGCANSKTRKSFDLTVDFEST